jgi:hypothetical protein
VREERPPGSKQRRRNEHDVAGQAQEGNRHAHDLGVAGVLDGLAAAGRAHDARAGLVDPKQVTADRDADERQGDRADPKAPVGHRASADSIAGRRASDASERTGTSWSFAPVRPT